MNNRKTTPTELTTKGIMLFSIFTVLQGVSVMENINKVWMVLVSFALLIRVLSYKYTLREFIVMVLMGIIHIIALLLTDFPVDTINILFYFAFWYLLYMFFYKSKDTIISCLRKSGRYIELILWGWTIIVGISAFLPSSYSGRYFVSFAGNSFRLMPAVLIISALAMYMAINRHNSRYNLFLILTTYAAFMNNSRTYFGVYLLFLMMYIFMCFRSRINFYEMLIPMTLAVIILMLFTGIMDKFRSTTYSADSYFNFWGTVTSGRTIFWKHDLEAFFELPILQQFVGNGFNFVYDVNETTISSRIWAHNDIINLLMNFGYIGVGIYFWSYFKMVNAYIPKSSKVPLEVKALCHGAIFINSMMNMSYTYLCAMISYPLFLCAISEKYE